jgi:hypothetical protein
MTFATMIDELRDWLETLSPEFAFLLALPFVIAIAGLAQEMLTNRKNKHRGTRRAGTANRRWSRVL